MARKYYSDTIGLEPTDTALWRIRTDPMGRQYWEFIDEAAAESDPQTQFVKYHLKTPDWNPPDLFNESEKSLKHRRAIDAVRAGATFMSYVQDENSGTFPVQYVGPMFMTIGMVAAKYFTKVLIKAEEKKEIIRYIVNMAHPVDGGWGLHSVDKSTCFGTSMNYVILRLLGLSADHPVCVKARATLHRLGGALRCPHWGKAWLAILNLYKWEGVNPAPPELFSLPYAVPIHPGRWWVHTRAIYLPLSYLSSKKVACPLDPLLLELRDELYVQPFDTIDFSRHRDDICGVDLYYPHSTVLNVANRAIVLYEKYLRPKWVLQRANNRVYDLIKKNLSNTDYLSIAPVSMAFEAIVTCLEEGRDSPQFARFIDRWRDFLFHGPEGMAIMGTNGVQVWDVAFMIQYMFVAGVAEEPEYREMILRGYRFLIRSQFDSECEPGSFRDRRNGGWPFSTKAQGFTVSDCTAEAMKAVIMVRNSSAFKEFRNEISDQRLYDAVDVLFQLQNLGSAYYGSFSSYERARAPQSLELLNPAEVFANIMVEYPYVECTDSTVLGLTYFHQNYPDYKSQQIETAINRAIGFIKRAQDPDGSWYGCWGVCYTYASMFAIEALHSIGLDYSTSPEVQRGCDFLARHQMPDGGWGESMKACELHTYVDTRDSLVVQTSWALIALLLGRYPQREVIERAVEFLMNKQLPTGEWEFDGVEGVFNHSCAIEYPMYRFYFPIKALGLYHQSLQAQD